MKNKRDAVIVGALRTPIGKKNGAFSSTRPDELLSQVLQAIVKESPTVLKEIEDVKVGCVTQVGEQGGNIARLSSLLAGLPPEIPASTINRQCGSSLEAFNQAAHSIMAGMNDVVIAAGIESMNRVPMGSDIAGNFNPNLLERYEIIPQGISAERIASKWGISRSQLDEFSLWSHKKAINAQVSGFFEKEIVPILIKEETRDLLIKSDESPRITTLEKMNTLPAAFIPNGLITAGNSSPINDGAASVLLMSREKAESLHLKVRAKVIATAVVGDDPTMALTAVIPATKKALDKAELKLSEIDLIEINEAFASVVLAWEKEMKPDMNKVNVNGGAISLGHPLGASGTRLVVTLLHELERRGGRYGLATLCVAQGVGIATIIEREL
jgi:acetyl-CoA acyltransferase